MTHLPTLTLWAVVLLEDTDPTSTQEMPCFCFFQDPDQRNTRIYATPDRGLAEYAAGRLRGANPTCKYDIMQLSLKEETSIETTGTSQGS